MCKHEIEVQIAVAASPHYYLLKEDDEGRLHLPTTLLGQEATADVAMKLYEELTGSALPDWADVNQAGFHEFEGRKVVLYAIFQPEKVPVTSGKWMTVFDITENCKDGVTLALLLHSCNYKDMMTP